MNGKATRRIPDDRLNPDGRQMRRFERELAQTAQVAFGNLKTALFDGLNDITAATALYRLDSHAVIVPFRDSIVRGLQEIAIAGAEFGREQVERQVFGIRVKQGGPITIDWQVANNAAAEWARQYGFDLIKGLTETTRKRLWAELEQFVQNQESLPELIVRLEDLFGIRRANLIGVTETTRLYYNGNKVAWKESGVIERKEWRTVGDEIVMRCPVCWPLDGAIALLDDPWIHPVYGPIEMPGHPGDRCWSVPVVSTEGMI